MLSPFNNTSVVSTTQWSAHYAAVKVMKEKFDEVTVAIEKFCDSRENLGHQGSCTKPSACSSQFHFPILSLFFGVMKLKEVNCTQVTLQTKTLSLDKSLIKLETLHLYIFGKRIEIVERVIENAFKATFEFVAKTKWLESKQKTKILYNLY